MDRHIQRSKRESIIAIKVVCVFLLTIVCFVFGLTASINNGNDVIPAFNGNGRKAISLLPGSDAADVTGEASSAPSPAPAQTPTPAPSGAVSQTAAAQSPETVKKTLLPLDTVNSMYKQYGSMTVAGMKPEDYDVAMAIEWRQLDTPGKPTDYMIDLADLMDYSAYEKYVFNLDKYQGVEASVIGQSEQGRNVYMVTVDFESGEAPAQDKPVIMLTGSVHAREFAGAEYIVKFLNDTIIKAKTDAYTRMLLESVTIVAVPLVNPDGREMIIDGGNKNRKSNANGVDLNRAMPAVNAGQLEKGLKREKNLSTKPGLDFFAGYNLGSESETQAMIKWFNYYVPKADVYIDLHQQGGSEYFDKTFLAAESDSLSKAYAVLNNKLLHKGYPLVREQKAYGMRGSGGTLTDYARSVSEGLVYSYSLGRMALDMDGMETPLLCFEDLDKCKQYYKPLNAGFKCVCIEIGRSRSYLGAGENARQKKEKEYARYGWDNFLAGTIENVLGEDRTDNIKLRSGIS